MLESRKFCEDQSRELESEILEKSELESDIFFRLCNPADMWWWTIRNLWSANVKKLLKMSGWSKHKKWHLNATASDKVFISMRLNHFLCTSYFEHQVCKHYKFSFSITLTWTSEFWCVTKMFKTSYACNCHKNHSLVLNTLASGCFRGFLEKKLPKCTWLCTGISPLLCGLRTWLKRQKTQQVF